MTSPSNLTVDGTSLTITNCTVTFNGGFDPTSGAAAITVTPTGNNASQLVATLPGLVNGQPGQPAQFRNVNLTQIAYGTSLPTPAATVSTVSPGGAGVPALYDLNLNLNSGAPGVNGTSGTLGGASDLSGTPNVGYAVTCNQTSPSTTFDYAAMPFGVVGVPPTTNSTSGNGITRTLCTVGFAAQPYPWYPVAFGSSIVTGTVNTRVDLYASLTTNTGQIIAYADGYTGDVGLTGPRALVAQLPTTLSLAKIAAGATATIYFVAQQQNVGVTDNWTTSAATTRFTVVAVPVSS